MTNTRAYAIGETMTITSTCHRKNCGLTTSRTFTATWFLGIDSDRIEWIGSCRCGAHLIHTSAAVIEIAEVDSTKGLTEKQLATVSAVRTQLTNVLENKWAGTPKYRSVVSRVLDVPITTMAGWVHPNESLMANVSLVTAMVVNPSMLGASPTAPSDPFAGIEDSYELDGNRPAVG